MNSRSIAGVSQIICTMSPRSAELAAATPFRRTCRRSPPFGPERKSGADFVGLCRRAQPWPPRPTALRCAPTGLCGCVRPASRRASPRPGDRSEIASSTLVLPAPLGPASTTGAAARRRSHRRHRSGNSSACSRVTARLARGQSARPAAPERARWSVGDVNAVTPASA